MSFLFKCCDKKKKETNSQKINVVLPAIKDDYSPGKSSLVFAEPELIGQDSVISHEGRKRGQTIIKANIEISEPKAFPNKLQAAEQTGLKSQISEVIVKRDFEMNERAQQTICGVVDPDLDSNKYSDSIYIQSLSSKKLQIPEIDKKLNTEETKDKITELIQKHQMQKSKQETSENRLNSFSFQREAELDKVNNNLEDESVGMEYNSQKNSEADNSRANQSDKFEESIYSKDNKLGQFDMKDEDIDIKDECNTIKSYLKSIKDHKTSAK